MIVDRINIYLSSQNTTFDTELSQNVGKLAELAFRRQFMEKRSQLPKTLRLSQGGHCSRKLAYSYHGFETKGKEIDSRAKVIFFMGDLVELMIINLAQLAGCELTHTGLDQKEIKLNINTLDIFGRPDGISTDIFGHPDGFYKGRLVECKSMSSFAFEDFLNGKIEEGYLSQINLYLEAEGLTECILIGVNKDSGVLHELLIHKDEIRVTEAKANLHLVLQSTADRLPFAPAKFAPDHKGFYPWQCLYCAYHGHCRPNAAKVLVNKRYKLKEIK